jgi:hypothetical protein
MQSSLDLTYKYLANGSINTINTIKNFSKKSFDGTIDDELDLEFIAIDGAECLGNLGDLIIKAQFKIAFNDVSNSHRELGELAAKLNKEEAAIICVDTLVKIAVQGLVN